MIIAVEGVDNSGKSTLALRLAEALKAIYVKSWFKPRGHVDLHCYIQMLEAAENLSDVVVTDRHMAVSELVYGSVLRDGPVFHEPSVASTLEHIHLVYCAPDADRMKGTLFERQQMEGVAQNFDALTAAYEKLIRTAQFASIPMTYDWGRPCSYEKLMKKIQTRRGQ